MNVWRWPKAPDPVRGDVTVSMIAVELRLALGLPPSEVAPGELAASRGKPFPRVVTAVDLGAWIAWSMAGLPLFTKEPMPTMTDTVAAARKVLLALAMERLGGNLTRVAEVLGMSRRTVRDWLREAGLYRVDVGAPDEPDPAD